LILTVVVTSDKFARISVIIPRPNVEVLCELLSVESKTDYKEHQKFLDHFGQPDAVEYSYLENGFGFGLYKEGVDIHVHYNLGGVNA